MSHPFYPSRFDEAAEEQIRAFKRSIAAIRAVPEVPLLPSYPGNVTPLPAPVKPSVDGGITKFVTTNAPVFYQFVKDVIVQHQSSVPERRESPVCRILGLALALTFLIPAMRSLSVDLLYEPGQCPPPLAEPCPVIVSYSDVSVLTAMLYAVVLSVVSYLSLSARVHAAAALACRFLYDNRSDILPAIAWVVIVSLGVYGSVHLYNAAYAPAAPVHQPKYAYEQWGIQQKFDDMWYWLGNSAVRVAREQATLASGLPIELLTLGAFPAGFLSTFLTLHTNGLCSALAFFGQVKSSGSYRSVLDLVVMLSTTSIAILFFAGAVSGRVVQASSAFLFQPCCRTRTVEVAMGKTIGSA